MLGFVADVNWLAVLACAVLSMVIGFIWYGPLFSKPWGRLTGWTNEKVAALPKSSMPVSYAMAFVAALVIAAVLAITLRAIGVQGIGAGVTVAVVLWAGFTGATIGVNMIFERRPLSLFAIEAGYHLVALIVYAIVLSVW
jgi:hypothetical protein